MAWHNGALLEYSITIVVHASDCKAIQCKPIDKQSALIVAIRPAQRNMIARLNTALFDVNRRCNAGTPPRIVACRASLAGNRSAAFLDNKRDQRQRSHAVEPPPAQDSRGRESDHQNDRQVSADN